MLTAMGYLVQQLSWICGRTDTYLNSVRTALSLFPKPGQTQVTNFKTSWVLFVSFFLSFFSFSHYFCEPRIYSSLIQSVPVPTGYQRQYELPPWTVPQVAQLGHTIRAGNTDLTAGCERCTCAAKTSSRFHVLSERRTVSGCSGGMCQTSGECSLR